MSLTGPMLVQGFVLACDISLQTPYETLNSHKAPTSASFINIFLKMYLSKTVTLPQRVISEYSPSYQGTLFFFLNEYTYLFTFTYYGFSARSYSDDKTQKSRIWAFPTELILQSV